MDKLFKLLSQLISFESITPDDRGCQKWMGEYLTSLGFKVTHFDNSPVANFYAQIGEQGPLLVFAGHTDVVDTGTLQDWHTPPFEATLIEDNVFGRGTADMKGSLAAMMLAAEQFIASNQTLNGKLGFLITSGEEGDQFDLGTPYVMEQLEKLDIKIDYCIVGEPSSTNKVGDVIKVGRRGSLTGDVTITGKQGHVAYPHLASNPIHLASTSIAELCNARWDESNDYFPPTTFQISNINAGTGAGNVIPGTLQFKFNFRYSTETSDNELKQQIESIFNKYELDYDIKWRLNGEPFLTQPSKLITTCQQAIEQVTGIKTESSTSGGTSDARFIAPYGIDVIELGPTNATIHQINEHTNLPQLHQLTKIYQSLITQLL